MKKVIIGLVLISLLFVVGCKSLICSEDVVKVKIVDTAKVEVMEKESENISEEDWERLTSSEHQYSDEGVTLSIVDYEFEKLSEDYGKLKKLTLGIINDQPGTFVVPTLKVEIIDKDSRYNAEKEIDLTAVFIPDEKVFYETIYVGLGLGNLDSAKQLKFRLFDSGNILVSVVVDDVVFGEE